jgi:hypothetical protein
MVFGFVAGYRLNFWSSIVYLVVLFLLILLRVALFFLIEHVLFQVVMGVLIVLNVISFIVVLRFSFMIQDLSEDEKDMLRPEVRICYSCC